MSILQKCRLMSELLLQNPTSIINFAFASSQEYKLGCDICSSNLLIQRMSFFSAQSNILIVCLSVQVGHVNFQPMKYSLTKTAESFFQFHGKSLLTKYTLLLQRESLGGNFHQQIAFIVSLGTQI